MPLAYVITVSVGVAAYYTAAAVSGIGACAVLLAVSRRCPEGHGAVPPCVSSSYLASTQPAHKPPSLLLLPDWLAAAQKGMLPLFPALKVLASAPFSLTSFALSLLLVFR